MKKYITNIIASFIVGSATAAFLVGCYPSENTHYVVTVYSNDGKPLKSYKTSHTPWTRRVGYGITLDDGRDVYFSGNVVIEEVR
jgi:hypothetical protein